MRDNRLEQALLEIERLKDICRDISDLISTSPDLIYEQKNYDKAINDIHDLAISGYAPLVTQRLTHDTL